MRRRKLSRLVVPEFVVSVGNLQVGGTGKTPTVIALVRALRQADACPTLAVLSRGYGRKGSAEGQVTNDALVWGDEPVLIAREGVPVFVGDSYDAAYRCLQAAYTGAQGPSVLILDDAFTQKDLAVDFDIVLWDGSRDGSDACLPYGNLRGPLEWLQDADWIVHRSESHPLTSNDVPAGLGGYSKLECTLLKDWLDSKEQVERPTTDVDAMNAEPLYAACGIGNPDGFRESLTRAGIRCDRLLALPDHCAWDSKDVARIRRILAENGCRRLIVTEKDAVKLQGRLEDLEVWVASAAFELPSGLSDAVLESAADHFNSTNMSESKAF